jgi:predicted permease
VTWWRGLLTRLRFWRRHQIDAELRHEIAAHIDEATAEYVRQGLSRDEARREAFRHFGGVAQAEDAYRDQLSFRWWDHIRRDIRQSSRGLIKTPGFSVVVVLVLALGTGAVTAVFALLNRIVLQPLPFPHAQQLVVIEHAAPGLNQSSVGLSDGLYFHYLSHARSLETLGLYTDAQRYTLRLSGTAAERVQITMTSVSLLQALGVAPSIGRLFTDEDARPGFMNMKWTVPILVSHEFWVDHLGRDPNVVGRILTINENSRQVVGVMPETFVFPDRQTQIWMLIGPGSNTKTFSQSFRWHALARLRPGISAASARAELTQVLPAIVGSYQDATPARLAELRLTPQVTSLKSALIGDIASVIWPLFGGMAFLLLIAWANAASLFLTRADNRVREIAVRQALGAGRRHVAQLFVVEALILTVTAAGLGLLVAHGLLRGVIALTPLELPRAGEIRLDVLAVIFATSIAALMAMFYAAASLRRQDRSVIVNLRDGEPWATANRGRRWLRDPLLAVQVSLALSLLIGSGLMAQTSHNLARRELGFVSSSLLTFDVTLPYRLSSQHPRVYQGLADRLRQLPGVVNAAAVSSVPLTTNEFMFPTESGAVPLTFKFFTPGYFQTMGTPIVAGERFAGADRGRYALPVLVSETLARRLAAGGDIVGRPIRRLNVDGTVVTLREPVPPFDVAGVVADVRETTLRADAAEIVYIPILDPVVEQSISPTNMTFVMRTAVPPLSLARTVRETAAAFDPSLSVGQVRTMDSIVENARGKELFAEMLLLLAAGVSLLLGIVGIYGGVAQVVRQRTREIGIRLALGAGSPEIVAMVISGSLVTVLLGTAIGLGVAYAGSDVLSALLFGIGPRNPVIFAGSTGLLLIAAIAAAAFASRRATRIAPVTAMRAD